MRKHVLEESLQVRRRPASSNELLHGLVNGEPTDEITTIERRGGT